MPDDPTRRTMRPMEPMPPAPAYGAVTFSQVALEGGVLCVECRACAKRTALTKAECSAIRVGNGRHVLHANFKCPLSGHSARRRHRERRPRNKDALTG